MTEHGIYAHAEGIHLRMIGRGPDQEAAEKVIEPVEAEIRRLIGDSIWGTDDAPRENAVPTAVTITTSTRLAIFPAFTNAPSHRLFLRPGAHSSGAASECWTVNSLPK